MTAASAALLAAATCWGASSRVLGTAGPRVAAETYASRHYDIYAENASAAEVAALLEALHEQLTKHFGVAPRQRLGVRLYATRERFLAALASDKQASVSGGGYYAPGTGRAYLFAAPSEQFTRQLVLHEATHQFHWLAASGNKAPSANWYDEGLSEYFGMSNWDGRTLETGTVPPVSLEDYPEQAARQLAEVKDLSLVLDGTTKVDRPLAWAMVHYLMHKDAEAFKRLGARLDARERPGEAWRSVYGQQPPVTSEALAQWLIARAQPWRIIWTSWSSRSGEVLQGCAEANALAVLKETPRKLQAQLEPVKGTLRAGLAVDYRSPQEFGLFQVRSNRWVLYRRAGGGWVLQASGPLPRSDAPVALAAEVVGSELALWANGSKVHTMPAGGLMGLNVDGCTVRFKVSCTATAPAASSQRHE